MILPDPSCKPEVEDRRVTFNLSLAEFYKCMVTKVVSQATGRTVFYQHVIVEYKGGLTLIMMMPQIKIKIK